MVRERLVPVGALGLGEQCAHRRDRVGVHLAFDLQLAHAGEGTRGRPPSLCPVARPRTPKGRTREVARRLAEEYPDAICALDHRNPYELLAATILSAQTTDIRVNMVTPALFAKYPTPFDLAAAAPPDVEDIVRSTGFYASKTKSLIGMAQALVERFDGEVPTALEDLVTIPGVGRKTGNVVRSVAFDLPGLPVDTHVRRLSNRLGLTIEGDPVKIELELNSLSPAAGAGPIQPADDPPRPADLRRQEPAMRAVRARGHLPVEQASQAPHRQSPHDCHRLTRSRNPSLSGDQPVPGIQSVAVDEAGV